ncbi:hypothetical protein ABZS66_00225 [Dactylosporangium sp. NPDC005572]|uniref:hypothetical protein n=1 Tax=Dactylosporangium sp. NPDC005572 TaxID=3156889 RepID=UPI0033B2A21F
MSPTAISPDGLLALRFRNARPGLNLIAVVDAAIPVSTLTVDVLAQDRKQLPLLAEFVLRMVSTGVKSTLSLAGALGVPEDMVKEAVASQFSADHLTYLRRGPQIQELQLTARGRRTADDLASITPVQVELPLVFDRLLWKIRPYDTSALMSRGQADEEGMLLLPAPRTDVVEPADIAAPEINALLRDQGTVNRQVLAVRRVVSGRARRVMPAKLLVYADAARTEVQLALVIDEDLSADHETALLNLGGAESLGIRAGQPEPRPSLGPELEQLRIPLDEATRMRTEAAAPRLASPVPVLADPAPEVQAVEDEVRAISVFEHPELLRDALAQARRRILLISPWIKNAVVNTEFLGALESRLRRNVAVHIAYGYERDTDDSDALAVRRLGNLSKRFPERFTFSRLKSSHAKILIYDDVWIATSFNWLSFRGSRDRTYRMEEGTLVRGAGRVDQQYERYVALIAQEAA